MSHSYIKIWVHAVVGTKYRRSYFQPGNEKIVYAFLKAKLEELGCKVNIINGAEDHIHILFALSREHSIGYLMKTIKGSSSHMINEKKLTDKKFEWQVGYYATGVDNENLDRVFHYIRNQKLHHKKQNFEEEYQELLKDLIQP